MKPSQRHITKWWKQRNIAKEQKLFIPENSPILFFTSKTCCESIGKKEEETKGFIVLSDILCVTYQHIAKQIFRLL